MQNMPVRPKKPKSFFGSQALSVQGVHPMGALEVPQEVDSQVSQTHMPGVPIQVPTKRSKRTFFCNFEATYDDSCLAKIIPALIPLWLLASASLHIGA